MIFKYIIFDFGFPVLFTPALAHNSVEIKGKKAVSAGFCKINIIDKEVHVRCYGESVGLNLKPLPHDAEIIKEFTSQELFKDYAEEALCSK